ncbi:MAG TPA: hypothetical protein VJU82_03105 [Acidobacteriaceae bacterium]|nr:hypothetical protein [Acidobacteriaceae bacterium]
MRSPSVPRRVALTAIAGALLLTSEAAAAKTTDYIDLEAGLGFSTNPFLQLHSHSTAFGRISAYGVHSWQTEKGSTTLTGYVENTTYFKDYGSKQIFDLGAHTNQAVSPTVTLFGDLDFSGDFAGQLSNRLLTVPSQPVVPVPGNPLPQPTTNPDLLGFTGRQYRASADVGASIRSGARGTISLSAGAQRSWFTGGNRDADYNSYFGTVGYSQQVSERTSAGASVQFQRQDFSHGDWANIVNPVVTLHTQLTESMVADAAVGVMYIQQRTSGFKDHQVTPSVSGSLCNVGNNSRFCVRVSRDAQSALSARILNGAGGAAVTTIAGVDYYRRLSEKETIQASLNATRYDTPGAINGFRIRTTYFSGIVGYDRKVGNRIYAGVSGGARKLFQDGPDPKLDFNANVYLRYRLGDLL